MGLANDPCWAGALPEELRFVLLGRDPDAPEVVRDWVRHRLARMTGERPWAFSGWSAASLQGTVRHAAKVGDISTEDAEWMTEALETAATMETQRADVRAALGEDLQVGSDGTADRPPEQTPACIPIRQGDVIEGFASADHELPDLPGVDYLGLLERIHVAGYGYESTWLGDLSGNDSTAVIGKFVVRKGRRKVGEWYAPNVDAAAHKAAVALGIPTEANVGNGIPRVTAR